MGSELIRLELPEELWLELWSLYSQRLASRTADVGCNRQFDHWEEYDITMVNTSSMAFCQVRSSASVVVR